MPASHPPQNVPERALSPRHPVAEWPGQTRWSLLPPAQADTWAPGRQHLGPQTSGRQPLVEPPPSAAAPPQEHPIPPPLDPQLVLAMERRAYEDRGCPLSPFSSAPVSTLTHWEREDKGGASQGTAQQPEAFPPLSLGARADAEALLPYLSPGLLWHVVAIGGLQLLLLPSCPVLPGQIPHSPLVFELPPLMPAQLHIPKKELLICQLSLQVLKLLSLPLS